jgi:hypothetical protein
MNNYVYIYIHLPLAMNINISCHVIALGRQGVTKVPPLAAAVVTALMGLAENGGAETQRALSGPPLGPERWRSHQQSSGTSGMKMGLEWDLFGHFLGTIWDRLTHENGFGMI